MRRSLGAWAAALLACAAGLAAAQPRLTERALGDTAVIQVPTGLTAERYAGYDDELMHRVAFQFSSTYLWASMSGVMRYRQLMVVSVLAADAESALIAEPPRSRTPCSARPAST